MTDSPLYPFPPVGEKQWKQQIQADLKGGDYNELLTWTSPEGILVKPFYTASDRGTSAGPGISRKGTWKIGVALDFREGDNIPQRAARALKGGADTLILEGMEAVADPGWAAQLPKEHPIWIALDDMYQNIPNLPQTATLLADPIGNLMATGNWGKGMEVDFETLAGLAASGCRLGIRGALYQQAGAHAVQEVAYILAHLREYAIRAENSPALKPLLEQPVLRVAIGGEYFMEIAKLRALRKGWALLAREHGYSGDCQIIAAPSLRNKTVYDYNTNMLRTTAESMAAILGGADVVCNIPYDALFHLPNEFGDRITRNQLLLLRHESYFTAVENPADGAYYIESLTDQLGRKSLELLKTLEKGGGLLQQLRGHQIQKKIRESHNKEQEAFDQGRRVLVGSNVFPNPEDRMAKALEKPVGMPKKRGRTEIEPLPLRRLASNYDLNRLKDEAR
ncbi:methylmalonyl-CoA mutase family protein [Robiginitalea sediminis]|uniref:methylmalonyl-CoA mutase family protein n=1 Tax=Robiginitalea sediminis TaxID=1982593 RepID=UPI001303F269|nr:methylmalonyl-CoA mutase family protein [Robiginitalea sediminis]